MAECLLCTAPVWKVTDISAGTTAPVFVLKLGHGTDKSKRYLGQKDSQHKAVIWLLGEGSSSLADSGRDNSISPLLPAHKYKAGQPFIKPMCLMFPVGEL